MNDKILAKQIEDLCNEFKAYLRQSNACWGNRQLIPSALMPSLL